VEAASSSTASITNVQQLTSYGAGNIAIFGASVQGRDLYEFKNLPKYDARGSLYTYTVKEILPSNTKYKTVVMNQTAITGGAQLDLNDSKNVEYLNYFYYVVFFGTQTK
jgi:hypothetical protein